MKTLEFHPLANLFPLIEGDEFEGLKTDIKARGLAEDIMLLDGKILDGRNRYRAAIAGGCKLRPDHFRHFTGPDPLAWVISKNLARRHLNESQRAMVAARLANMRQGERTDKEPSAKLQKVSQTQAAGTLHVSARTVSDAAKVEAKATPQIKSAVDRGVLPVSVAAKIAELPAAEQRRLARAPERAAIELKQISRDDREKELGKKQRALPDKKFGVILADPEWRFEPYSRETGMDRAADNHYPTSETDDICKRDVRSIAADDCVLFLWATAPMLPDALKVMEAWGFAYKSHAIWHKIRSGDGRGSGYWFTGEHELLLVGTRGNIPAPATAICGSLIAAPWQGKHSAKPEAFAEFIEREFPNLPKIELNRRGSARPGWEAWGNEAEGQATAGNIEQVEGQEAETQDSAPVATEITTTPLLDAAKGQLAEVDDDDDGTGIPKFLRRQANPQAEAG